MTRATVEVTRLYCPESGGQPGEDSTTHHMQRRSGVMVCRYCNRTEKQLRDAAVDTKAQCPSKIGGDALHHEDGTHRTTPASTSGRALERHEANLVKHLAGLPSSKAGA